MQLTINFLLAVSCLTLLLVKCQNADAQNLQQLSYGGGEFQVGQHLPTTELPPATTKKGFFSGIRNFFSRESTTQPPSTVVTAPSVLPAHPAIPVSGNPTPNSFPASGNNNRDFVNTNAGPPRVPPSSPTLHGSTPNSFPYPQPTGSVPTNNRDFVNPNIPNPRIPPSSPTYPGPTGVVPNAPRPSSPTNTRDYVNPNRPGPFPAPSPSSQTNVNNPNVIPARAPTLPNPSPQTPSVQPPTNRRDYVNPNVGPGQPPRSAAPVSPSNPSNFPPQYPSQQPPLGGRDYVNPNLSPDNFPALPSPRRPGSPPIDSHTPNLQMGGSPGGAHGTSGNRSPSSRPNSPRNQYRTTQRPRLGSASQDTTSLATDDELMALTDELFSKDTNNQNSRVTINYQGRTRSSDTSDEAPQPLLQVQDAALQSPTIEKMRALFNNYEMDTSVNEVVTPLERKEENDFIDAVMATSVMRRAMQFLQDKGVVTPDPQTHRDYLKTLWFTMYSRGGGRIGSSSFEHVFVSEMKNGEVTGLHNWVYFHEMEKSGNIDYKGHIHKLELGQKGAIVKFRFDLNGVKKPVNTMFVGTSPELEMALYTVCFQMRANQDCPIQYNGKRFNMRTYNFRYRGKNLIGSGFPEI